ncbi:MAG: amidohydrolase, partial [Gemmatimonadaceae bacterium]
MSSNRSLLAALVLASATGHAQDAIYVNGRFVTLNAAGTIAQGVAVRDGRIVAVGTSDEMRRFAGPQTRSIDMGGKTVIPGFYDNHVHLGEDLQEWKGGMIGAVPEWLTGVETMAQLLPALRKRAESTPPNGWIRGSLSREVWPNQKVPTRWQLDSAAPNHAVALARGPHTLLLNSRALALAGITKATPNPPGGWIIRDANGEPNGRVLEAARRMVERVAPQGARRGAVGGASSSDATIARYRKFLGHMASLGITSLNVAGVGPADLRVLQELYDRRGPELPRMTVQIRLSPGHDTYDDTERGVRESIALMEGLGFRTGFGTDRLKIGAIKMSIDGGLSAPVFWSLEAYKGRPGFFGAQRIPNEAFYRVAKRAHELGWQLGIHTMGDAAAAMVVDQLGKILGELPRADHRHYLHHVAVLPPNATLEKMQRHGIMVASQPG